MTMEHHTDWSSSPWHVPVNKQQYLERHRLWQARWMALQYWISPMVPPEL
jgi:hypothetical protein